MAILVHNQGSDWNADLYDQIFAKIIPDPSNPPAGMLSHAATAKGGGWQVVDVWESQDAFDSFMSEKVMPAAQEINAPRSTRRRSRSTTP